VVLVYPDDYDEQVNPFKHLYKRILLKGTIPRASMYFAGFFSARGIAHQDYHQCYTYFVKEQLKEFSGSWRLTERLIGIGVQGMQVEVLFYRTG
jgi:hypothetical protein